MYGRKGVTTMGDNGYWAMHYTEKLRDHDECKGLTGANIMTGCGDLIGGVLKAIKGRTDTGDVETADGKGSEAAKGQAADMKRVQGRCKRKSKGRRFG